MAKIEQNESKLAESRIANADKYQDILDEIESKKYQYSVAEEKLAKAKESRDTSAIKKYQSQIEKLDAKLEELDNKRVRSAERAKRAEEHLTKQIAKQREEYSKMNVEYLKTKEKLGNATTTLFRAMGIGTATLMVRKFAQALSRAGEEAKKLQDEFYDKGIFNPEAWTQTNQQLAKFGSLTQGSTELFSDIGKSGLALATTLGEMLFTWSSYSTISKENEETAKRNEEIARKLVERKKEQERIAKSIKQLDQELLEILERRRKEEETIQQAEQKRYEENIKLISQEVKAREDYYWSNLSAQEQLNKLLEKQKSLKWDVQRFDKNSVAYNKANLELTQTKIQIDKIQNQLAKERLKDLEQSQKKAESEAKKLADKQKQTAEARKDFELETKIEVLKKQGRTKEAEAIEFAKKRNELMAKYGYNIEQATRVQKTLNALQKGEGGIKYSDEAKEKAERVLAKGKKGTIGKRDLEEAKAIVEGREVEGGFKSAMFQKYKDAKAPTFKDININSKATKEQLDKESQKLEKESADALKNVEAELVGLNALIKELKSSVDLIATKETKIAQ